MFLCRVENIQRNRKTKFFVSFLQFFFFVKKVPLEANENKS